MREIQSVIEENCINTVKRVIIILKTLFNNKKFRKNEISSFFCLKKYKVSPQEGAVSP